MFFALSKIFWLVAAPSTLFILLLCLKRHAALIVLAFIMLILPVGDVLYFWEHQVKPAKTEQVDGIIILGGAINPMLSEEVGHISFNAAAERLTALIPLAKKYPKAKIIFSGGSGDIQNQGHREADDAAALFAEWGLPADRITYERNSRNTWENAVFSKKLVKPKKHENWLLITSASHMTRAKAVFDKAGWRTLPYPVDYRARKNPDLFCVCLGDNLNKIDILVHEIIGLFIYRWTGKA